MATSNIGACACCGCDCCEGYTVPTTLYLTAYTERPVGFPECPLDVSPVVLTYAAGVWSGTLEFPNGEDLALELFCTDCQWYINATGCHTEVNPEGPYPLCGPGETPDPDACHTCDPFELFTEITGGGGAPACYCNGAILLFVHITE